MAHNLKKLITATGILLLVTNESVNAHQFKKFASIGQQVDSENAEDKHAMEFSVFDDILANGGHKKEDDQKMSAQ